MKSLNYLNDQNFSFATHSDNSYPETDAGIRSNNSAPHDVTWEHIFVAHFALIVEGYGITIIAVCGMISNIAGIFYTLAKSQRDKLFNMILSTLVTFDTVFLSCTLVSVLDRFFMPIPIINVWVGVYLLHPLVRISMAMSIFLTLALAQERFDAVNKPIQHRNSLHSAKNRRHRLFKYLFIGIILSVVLNAPVFWEMDILYDNSDPPIPYSELSAFRQNPYYSLIYVNIIRLLAFGIVPISCLIYLNYRIVKARNSTTVWAPQLRSSVGRTTTVTETVMTKSLISIVIVFVICNLPRVVMNSIEYFILKQLDSLPNNYPNDVSFNFVFFFMIMQSISELLLVLNSSLNIVLYMSFKTINVYYRANTADTNARLLVDQPHFELKRMRSRTI